MGEHADRVSWPEDGADLRQVLVGPGHHHLVRHREAGPGGEHRAGVAHRHPIAQDLGHLGQGGREVDRAEDDHPRGWRKRLDEHRHIPGPGLAVPAVVAGDGQAGGQLALGVPADHPIQVGISDRAEQLRWRAGQHQQLAAEQFGGPSMTSARAAGCSARSAAARASKRPVTSPADSTKIRMVPPQVSPTANASSSE